MFVFLSSSFQAKAKQVLAVDVGIRQWGDSELSFSST